MTDHADTIPMSDAHLRDTLVLALSGTKPPDEIAWATLKRWDALRAERQRLLDGAMRDATVHEAHRVEIERLRAERQQAQDKLWEQSEAAANLITEVDRLEAERQQAQKELQIATEVLGMAKRMAEDMAIERQQAIDALREIARDDYRVGTFERRGEIARAALLKLEKP